MSTPVVRCSCSWLLAAVSAIAAASCAGTAAQKNALAGAAEENPPAAQPRFALPSWATLVDLSHEIDAEATSWTNADLRAARRDARANGREVGFVTAEDTAESRGFGADRATTSSESDPAKPVARPPRLRRLVAPLVVIDMCSRAAEDPDAELRVEDVEEHERNYGAIAPGSAVLARTCWYWRWSNRKRYLGVADNGPERYHFPGISGPAANLLIDRAVVAVAIDTAGVDHGPSIGRAVQRTLEQAEVAVFANIIAYQDLPARGALLVALPMRIPGSTPTPMRVLALTP